MAARLNLKHQDSVRSKIKAGEMEGLSEADDQWAP